MKILQILCVISMVTGIYGAEGLCSNFRTKCSENLREKCAHERPCLCQVKMHIVPLCVCVGCTTAGVCTKGVSCCLTGLLVGILGCWCAPRDINQNERTPLVL